MGLYEAWDERAELLVSNEAKEGEVEKGEIRGVRIKSREMGGGKAGESEEEDCGIGRCVALEERKKRDERSRETAGSSPEMHQNEKVNTLKILRKK